ncbi:MAG TPA: hypothetical protein VF051_11015 [Hyphomicrobiaceae bacterium]|jgi:hypothetical protein
MNNMRELSADELNDVAGGHWAIEGAKILIGLAVEKIIDGLTDPPQKWDPVKAKKQILSGQWPTW